MPNSQRVALYTLGCKLNYSETSTIGRLFVNQGFEEVQFTDHADIYVINTCSVTDHADKKCRKIVKEALKINSQAYIVIIGCYAQLKPQEISEIPGVDLVLGAAEKFQLLNYLKDLGKEPKALIYNQGIENATSYSGSYSIGDRTRTFLKVQDGCDYSCSFCTIPLARGASRSQTISSVLESINEITDSGVKEIVLTGVNLGDFGTKETGDFFTLIKEIDQFSAIPRFRISSIEPNLLTDDIISFVANSQRFVPHFHIPLQSGSNKILSLMRRRYRRELYAERIQLIKEKMPHCCIGVDVIVGFPGETKEDFLETYQFLNDLPISYLHVFTYSERANTPAILMTSKVIGSTATERNSMLRILSEKKKNQFYSEHLNTERTVLFEADHKDGMMHGFTDNYIKVLCKYDPLLINELKVITLSKINPTGEMNITETAEILIHL